MMLLLDVVYFFVPLFGFAVLVELLHFLPFIKRITEKRVYENLYSVMIIFLVSFVVFEVSFITKLFFGNEAVHKLLEIIAMSIVLLETVVVVRRSEVELEVMSATKDSLERSEKKYRSLIENMNDGFWALDKTGTITMINQKLAEMIGYNETELIGRDVMELLDETSKIEMKKQEKQRPQGISSIYELEIIKKDDNRFPVFVSASPLYAEDKLFAGSFAIITDISSRKEMEEQIKSYSQNLERMVEKRTEEAVKARDSVMNMLEDLTESKKDLIYAYDELRDVDRLKTDIISNISHELRTPITIAKSAIELTMEENNPEEFNKYLKMCENALTRLNELVENLVDVSAIYRGDVKLKSAPVDLNEVILEVLKEFSAIAGKREIILQNHIKSTLPRIRGDKKALRKALTNLVDNAIKFNHKGGTVTIKAKKEGNFLQISIIDSGIGIESKYKEKIFESFFQIDPTTTRIYGGTGIGLALVKANIESQKGRISMKSTPKKGSTFIIKLPFEEEKDL